MLKNREEFGKYFIYLIFILWFGSEILINTTMTKVLFWDVDAFDEVMAIIVFVLLLIQIAFFQKYTKSEMIIIFLISVLVAFAVINASNNSLMSTWLFVIASKYIDFDRIMLCAYIMLIVLSLAVIYLFFNGYINEVVVYRGQYLRHSWGFIHPNTLGVRVFQIVITHFYLRRNKLNVFDYSLIIIMVFFLYKIPNCQTACLALLVFMILLIIKRFFEMFENGITIFSKAVILLAILANLLSVLISIIGVEHNRILMELDRFMSSRFSLCHKVYLHYGITFLGQNLNLNRIVMKHKIIKYYLDMAYMAMLLRYGVLVYFVFSALFIATMIVVYRNKQYMLIVILGTYAIYGIMENTFFSLN